MPWRRLVHVGIAASLLGATLHAAHAAPDHVRLDAGGSVVYAALAQQYERSGDDGEHWDELNGTAWDAHEEVSALAVAPGDPSVVYAGITGGEGIFVSNDGGDSFVNAGHGLVGLDQTTISSLVVAPSDGATLYAVAAAPAIYRTDDGGADWHALPVPRHTTPAVIAVSPRDSTTVLLGTDHGIFRSVDRGRTWDAGSAMPSVQAITFSPSGATAFAGTAKGLYLTIDGGNSWRLVQGGLPSAASYTAVAIGAAASTGLPVLVGTAAGQILRSGDGGMHWSVAFDTHGRRITALAFDPVGGVFLAGTAADLAANNIPILRGDGRGAHWHTPGNEGIYNPEDVTALVVGVRSAHPTGTPTPLSGSPCGGPAAGVPPQATPAQPAPSPTPAVARRTVFYIGEDFAYVQTSGDDGDHWAGYSLDDRNRTAVSAVAVAPGRPDIAYAALFDSAIVVTTDGGKTWDNPYLPAADEAATEAQRDLRDVTSLAVDPRDGQTVFAVTQGHGLYLTRDGGATWKALNLPATSMANVVRIDPLHPTVVLVGTSKYGVCRSTDGGAHWGQTALNTGVGISDLAFSLSDPLLVFAAASDGLHRSSDGGATWGAPISVPAFGAGIAVVAVGARSTAGSTVLAETGDGRIFRSPDTGATWKRVYTLPKAAGIVPIAFDPARPNVVLAGGTLRSGNRGISWAATKSAPTYGIFCMAVASGAPAA